MEEQATKTKARLNELEVADVSINLAEHLRLGGADRREGTRPGCARGVWGWRGRKGRREGRRDRGRGGKEGRVMGVRESGSQGGGGRSGIIHQTSGKIIASSVNGPHARKLLETKQRRWVEADAGLG